MIARKDQVSRASAAPRTQVDFYEQVMERSHRLLRMDPVRVVHDVAADVGNFNERQQHSEPMEVNLQRIWEWRQKFAKVGVLELHPEERSWPQFFRKWRQIRLERDLSHETLDAATLLRTIYTRHQAAKGMSPFWFLFDHDGRLLRRVFRNEFVEFTDLQRDLTRASALRSAPPEKLLASIKYIVEPPQGAQPMDAELKRFLFLKLLGEMQRRVKEAGAKPGAKPAYRKPAEGGPYIAAAEYEYAKTIAPLMPGMQANAIWRIGSERYLATNPLTSAKRRALKAHQTGDEQMTMGFALKTEGRRTWASRGQQARDPKGRFDRDFPNAVAPVRAFVARQRQRTA